MEVCVPAGAIYGTGTLPATVTYTAQAAFGRYAGTAYGDWATIIVTLLLHRLSLLAGTGR